MATHSYVVAGLTKWDGLTAALFPGGTVTPIYFGEAPQVAGGSQRRTPYVVMKDRGSKPAFQSDNGGTQIGGFDLECYADTLADVDKIVAAARWNGSPPASRAGFDGGTLTLDAPLYHVHLLLTDERRSLEGLGQAGQRIHKCLLSYAVMQGIDATAAPA